MVGDVGVHIEVTVGSIGLLATLILEGGATRRAFPNGRRSL